jgi:pyruvate dehydrogenase (quinone)
MADWRQLLAARGTRRETPMKPQVVTHELDALLDEDAIVATDSGTVTTWVARHLTMRAGRKFSCSGTLATMACGVPYAIAAAIAYPGRQVVAVADDGAMAMLLGELATIRKYDLNLKVIVIKNNTLGMIKWEQMVFLGNPEYGCELEPIDFALVAQACGLRSARIEDPARCGAQLREAFAAPGPFLIEAVVDPHEPPLPPKIETEQALHLIEALAKGTADRAEIIKTLGADVVRQMV